MKKFITCLALFLCFSAIVLFSSCGFGGEAKSTAPSLDANAATISEGQVDCEDDQYKDYKECLEAEDNYIDDIWDGSSDFNNSKYVLEEIK